MPLTRPGPALVKVTGWFGGTPLHEPAYRGIAKRSKAWDFDSHIRRFKSCDPCQPPVGVLRATTFNMGENTAIHSRTQ